MSGVRRDAFVGTNAELGTLERVRLVRLIGEARGEVLGMVGWVGYVLGRREGRVLVWFPRAGRAPYEFSPAELEELP